MQWFKLHGGDLDADSNAFDQYHGPEGRATIFRNGSTLFGFITPWDGPERRWGPEPIPPEGNVQALRIFPEGQWVAYAVTDPKDGKRAHWGGVVAPL